MASCAARITIQCASKWLSLSFHFYFYFLHDVEAGLKRIKEVNHGSLHNFPKLKYDPFLLMSTKIPSMRILLILHCSSLYKTSEAIQPCKGPNKQVLKFKSKTCSQGRSLKQVCTSRHSFFIKNFSHLLFETVPKMSHK